jgi:ubiquitin carboxyl-terminal hydrolase 14
LTEFKAQLETLSNVPSDRQKLICKGKTIDDDAKYNAISDKGIIMMVGSAATIQVTEGKTTVDDSQIDSGLILPPGLTNLGNTCWMNGSLKALYSVIEFREALIELYVEHSGEKHQNHICQYKTATNAGVGSIQPSKDEIDVAVAIGGLYKSIKDQTAKGEYDEDAPITPVNVIMAISRAYPQLFDVSAKTHEQQDADEFLTMLMTSLDKILIKKIDDKFQYLIRELFFIDVEIVTKKKQDAENTKMGDGDDDGDGDGDDEKKDQSEKVQQEKVKNEVISYDTWTKLRADVNIDLSDIQGGIKNTLTEIIEKKENGSGSVNVEYNRQHLFVTLPKYLIVHLQRFQWKKESNSRAKVIRKVNINPQLDLYPYCTEDKQREIEPFRKTIDSMRQETVLAMQDGQTVQKEHKPAGYYDLLSIISHQGRSADSGHYVGWTKTGNNKYNENALTGMSEKEKDKLREQQQTRAWIKHDDTRSSFASEKILYDLAGGGDFHMVYVCIYKAKTD